MCQILFIELSTLVHTIFSSEPITTMSITTWNYFFLSAPFSDSPSSHYSSSSFPPLHFLISFFLFLFLRKRYLFSPLAFPFLLLFFLPLTLPLLPVLFWDVRTSGLFNLRKNVSPALLPVEQQVWTEAIYSHGIREVWFISCILKHSSKGPKNS